MLWYTFVSSTKEPESKGSQILGQPELHSDTVSKENRKKKKKICEVYSVFNSITRVASETFNPIFLQLTQSLLVPRTGVYVVALPFRLPEMISALSTPSPIC